MITVLAWVLATWGGVALLVLVLLARAVMRDRKTVPRCLTFRQKRCLRAARKRRRVPGLPLDGAPLTAREWRYLDDLDGAYRCATAREPVYGRRPGTDGSGE